MAWPTGVFSLVFLFISRTLAFKILVEVVTGNDFGFLVALAEYNPQVLIRAGIALYSIHRAGTIVEVALSVVDLTATHNVFNIFLRNLPALHTATCMFGIFNVRDCAVKAALTIAISVTPFRC
jgi:hypothetical protein